MKNIKKLIALEMKAKVAFEAAWAAMQAVAEMADSGDEWAVKLLFEYSIPATQKASGNYDKIQRRLDSLNIVVAS